MNRRKHILQVLLCVIVHVFACVYGYCDSDYDCVYRKKRIFIPIYLNIVMLSFTWSLLTHESPYKQQMIRRSFSCSRGVYHCTIVLVVMSKTVYILYCLQSVCCLCRCADTTVKLQLCSEQLSQVSDIVHFVDLPEDGGPLTVQWMQRRLDEIGMEKTRCCINVASRFVII